MKYILCLFLLVLYYGCATIPQGTAPSAYPLVTEDGKAISYQKIGLSEGTAGHFELFGLMAFGKTDIQEAIREAVRRLNGDNLINVHYYVNVNSYIIGNTISITVKGDVVKYTEELQNTNNEDTESYKKTDPVTDFPDKVKWIGATIHGLSLGGIDGSYYGYSFSKELNAVSFFEISLGYKKLEIENGSYGPYSFYKRENSIYHFFPLNINIGLQSKNIKSIEIPINLFSSVGLSYLPFQEKGASSLNEENYGVNFSIGFNAMVKEGFGIGLEYRIHHAIGEKLRLGYYGMAEEVNISNLNLNILYFP